MLSVINLKSYSFINITVAARVRSAPLKMSPTDVAVEATNVI